MQTAHRPLGLGIAVVVLLAGSGAARADVVYDFSNNAGVNRFAYRFSIPNSPIPPTSNTIPSTAFTAEQYTFVAASDNVRQTTVLVGGSSRAAVRYVFSIAEPAATLESLGVLWEGRTAGGAGGTVEIWLWNATTGSYVRIGQTSSTSDATISSSFTTNAAEFVDSLNGNSVTILALNATDNAAVSADYVRLAVRQCSVAEDCDDNNPCTDQSCSEAGACVYTNNSASCSDGNPCTLSDVCAAGVCQGGAAPNCSTSGNQCNTASCSPIGAEGNCDTLTPVENGTDCDDGLACNVGESCQSGSCTGGSSPDCSTSGGQCNTASCNSAGAEGNCDTLTPVENGTDCDDGLACNVGEACLDGTCTGGTSPNCSTSGDQCNTASCNPAGAEGNCDTLTPVENGTVCEDDLFCNVGETCTDGACGGGTPRDCSAEADQCNTGTCNETTNECQAQPVGNGADCDDGLACNVGEACLDGTCTGGTTQDCSTSGNQCNTASCNPAGAEGNCETLTPVGNGTDCDDGLACNVGEACLDGTCTGGTTQDCSTAGDQCNTASCSPTGTEGNCDTLTPVQNGTDCDDGLACSVGEACLDGACTGGAAQDCSTAGDQCNTASCNPAGTEGNCATLTPVIDGTTCEDGLFCTVGEVCTTGVCGGGTPRDCGTFTNQCNTGTCNENTDACEAVPVADDTDCDDGLACNVGESCQAGVCTGGTAQDCSTAGDQCNTASCNPAGAEGNCDTLTPVENGTVCEDDLFCNAGETCTDGACGGGTPRDCSAEADQCNTGTCNETADECQPQPVTDGADCDDGLACNVGEACLDGTCTGGTTQDCSTSGNQCNTASCNPTGAEGNCDTLTPVIDGTDCDDGLACNVGEACLDGTCTGGTSPDCSTAGDQCNTATCSPIGAEGNCDTLTPVQNGTDCDDGLACNVGEACLDGACTGGAAQDCSTAGDQCNIASCNPTGAEGNCATLTPVIDGTTCEDGLFCTVGEVCTTGVCGGGTPRDCSDEADQCNTGTCNETADECQPQPVTDGTDCNDGLACNVGEACLDGTCTGGTSPDCSTSGDQCNTASCNPTGTEGNCETLTPVENGTACDDDLFCNVGEICTAGECGGGTLRDCSAEADQCNTGTCNETADECQPQPVTDGADCDDGLACNVGEACLDGTCTGGTTQDCSTSGNQCNTASCSPTGAEGNCDTLTSVIDGTDCEDGLACNVGEACLDGTCTGGTTQDCSTAGDQCNTASCSPTGTEGNCDTLTPVENGTDCDDGLACNVGEACLDGTCTGGTSQDCSTSGDQCNIASCNPTGAEGNCATLTPVKDGTTCDDGMFCFTEDVCTGGICGGTARDCSDITDQCNTGVCNETSDACEAQPVADGTECDDGLFATTDDVCTNGVCGGAPRDCSAFTDDCNIGVANEETDTCEAQPRADGTTCDDDLFCTVDDVCTVGVCGGTPRDCSAEADQCNTGTCNETTNECQAQPVGNGADCDDGLACNVGEACLDGTCTGGTTQDCSTSGNQCNTASCNPAGAEGNCETLTPVGNGTDCDDGLACNVGEACLDGTCTGGTTQDCSTAGDQCNTASCSPTGTEGNCDTLTPVQNGTDCDDGLACSVGEACLDGACTGGAAQDCSTAGDQCNTASCNPAGTEGNCATLTPVIDGTTCEDGLFCTVGEVCTTGVCGGGTPRDCGTFTNQCNTGTCNENTDACEAVPVADDTDCDDGLACNVGESCQAGVCTGGTAQDCSTAGDQCNTASCNPAGAEGNCDTLTPVENGTVCEDDLFCNAGETCTDGACGGGTPRDCSAEADQCNTGTCNETADECQPQPVTDGADCDDGLACNVGEACLDGTCTGGTTQDCSTSGNQCNTASCNPTGAEGNCDTLTPVIDGTDCDDGLACNVGEACLDGTCTGGTSPDCSTAGDQCNTATCSPIGAEGNCDTLTPVQNGTDCDDGLACNVGEACLDGACTGGAAQDCSTAGDQCNIASCNPTGAEGNCATLTPVIDGTTCEDGLFCTVGEVCTTGVCGGGTPRDCSDEADQCNTGTCNETADECQPQPVTDGTDCNDGLACNVGEACLDGTCTGGTSPDCSTSGDQCNTASCNPTGTEGNCETLTPVENGTACDDDLFCNVGEICTAGECGGGTLRDCSAEADQCNTGTCNETADECQPQPVTDGADCDDGLACNVGEACLDGTCTGGTTQDCSTSGNQCNTASCSPTGAEGNCDTLTSVIDGTDCEDGLACNVGEACLDGTCTGGTTQDCSTAGDQCNTASCSPTGTEGNCDTLTPVENGTDCDDGLACNVGEACLDGTCTGGTSQDCSTSGDQCNIASCNPTGAEGNCATLTPVKDGTTCDDGMFCFTEDVCTGGICGGTARDCSDITDQCNTGVCNETSDACEAQPVADGTECDDGLFCNVEEVCKLGVCGGGTLRDCSAEADQCNTGTCNESADACQSEPVVDGTTCGDGNDCTSDDQCHSGTCQGVERYRDIEWGRFHGCFDGVGIAYRPGCDCFALDADGDVDLRDAADFMRRFETD